MAKKKTTSAETSTTQAAPATEGKTKSKYETMIVGVSKQRKELRTRMEEAAVKLGCKPSDLIWYAIEQVLANPPKIAPSGSTTNVGSAAGFWTVPVLDSKNRAVSVKVTEVESRGDVVGGRTFFRFKKGDAKERGRAKAQAIRGAQADANMIGFKGEIEVEEIAANAE